MHPNLSRVYTNAITGFYFPPYLDGFQRELVTFYTPARNDISVGYGVPGGIEMTVYVYPIPAEGPDSTFDGHYARCKNTVMVERDNVQLVSEQPVVISPNASHQTGRKAIFTYTGMFNHRRELLHSELYLFTHGQQYVLYRVTCPERYQTEAKPYIDLFMDDFPWP